MYLIEILLPTCDNNGHAFDTREFERVRAELIERFGGVTAFFRSPAEGLWEDNRGKVQTDNIAVVEVMTDTLDRSWWREYRHQLERQFRQQELVVRATALELL